MTEPSHDFDNDKLWEWSLHEDNLFTNRVNFMLVAESMLFAAFATVLVAAPAGTKEHTGTLAIIGVLGGMVSLVWLYIAKIQIFQVSKPIQIELKKNFPRYEDIRKKQGWWPIHPIIGLGLPAVLIGGWVALLFFNL